ncbi:SCO family protein [Sphingomonas sanxanigenens]|uniref:Thioredoxin domain-containing protein n=1 Tax=Sphingomonas sanxanigenens DSM 19645 = NX02 TaxID=1123269 RepID=W0AK75_9SPHN|nr:SCO family protein [Sphingomonas sanxanigenens]AHE56703.1 hypothetical protein NX02_25485 [Sphingomonas sanxanigenens DSM 19645 = NX02]
MNIALRNLRGPAAALALLLAPLVLSGCGPSSEAPLAGARIGGPFALTDQNGKRMTDQALAGKYRIMYFGYSYCPDVCPTDLALITAGLKAFEAKAPALAAKVQPVFVTIDPARDTPARLKTYLADFHPRLIGLTGSAAEIAAIARAYGVPYSRGEGAGDAYMMNHGNQVYLMAPDGAPIALMPTEPGRTPQDFAGELTRWVK